VFFFVPDLGTRREGSEMKAEVLQVGPGLPNSPILWSTESTVFMLEAMLGDRGLIELLSRLQLVWREPVLSFNNANLETHPDIPSSVGLL